MKIQPLDDRAVIQASSEEEVTKSGIILPDTAEKEKPEQGEIIAVGPGKLLKNGERAPLSVKIGDKVLFTKYGPTEVKIAGKEYLIVAESDILAILK